MRCSSKIVQESSKTMENASKSTKILPKQPRQAFSRPLRPKPQPAPASKLEASAESALQWQRLLAAAEADWEEMLKAWRLIQKA